MANIRDLINNLKKIEEELPEVLRKSATIMAHDAKALAERIIKEKGFGAEYSTKKLPAIWFYENTLNASGKSYLDELDDDEGTNWGEFRKAQGLQSNHVDLSYTTRMWKGMRPDAVQEKEGKYFCVMGHNDNEGKRKMNWNFERYGDFIGKALKGQEDILSEVALENLEELLNKYL